MRVGLLLLASRTSWFRLALITVFLVHYSGPARGQSHQQNSVGEAMPRFEVASVKRSGTTSMRMAWNSGPMQSPIRPVKYTPGRLTCNLALRSLIREAYSVKSWQVNGPAWLDVDTYDISSTMPPDTSKATARLMLQALLAERFGLKLHREQKESPVYVLIAAKSGVKLEPVLPKPDHWDQSMSAGRFTATAVPLSSFADSLSGMLDLPVIDLTGLTNVYRIDLRWTPEYQTEPKRWDAAVLTAVQHLGLKLEVRKAPVEYLVIDHAERDPTAN